MKKYKVLIVDDNPLDRANLRIALIESGLAELPVLEAQDGIEALSILDRHPEIDWMFTDVHMPMIDGWELVDRVRKTDTGSRLKITIVSSHVEPKRAERFGADTLKKGEDFRPHLKIAC